MAFSDPIVHGVESITAVVDEIGTLNSAACVTLTFQQIDIFRQRGSAEQEIYFRNADLARRYAAAINSVFTGQIGVIKGEEKSDAQIIADEMAGF